MTPQEAMAAWAMACSEYDDAQDAYRAAGAAYRAAVTGPLTVRKELITRGGLAEGVLAAARKAARSAHAHAFLAYSTAHGTDVADLFLRLAPTQTVCPGQVEDVIAALLAPPTGPTR